MSWFRSAVVRAVEAGGGKKLTRTVRNVADTVVQQAGNAVFESAKILQDRIAYASRNTKSFKQAVKRLEDVSVSTTGIERVHLLRRWLVALKETIRIFEGSMEYSGKHSSQLNIFDEKKDFPKSLTVELYYDPDIGGEPMNFYDVFLYSEALEGITLSMILEAPTEEELSLLLEIYGLCLIGGKEVHEVIVRSIQSLAKDFSSYEDEVLVKKEELLQYAQGAIAGLKVNADIKRIDSEVSDIRRKLDDMNHRNHSIQSAEKSSQSTSECTVENLKESVAKFQLCSRLEALLLKKKVLNNGDSSETHSQKVDKLKVLTESLHGSASKAEKRIRDHRMQKEEALSFRVNKTNEVTQLQKDLEAELRSLQNRKTEIEDELKKVNTALTITTARLRNAREERDQFDQASNEILELFNTKEDELSRSIGSYRAEANACNAFIVFMESAWGFHSSYKEQKEKQVSNELKKHEEYFLNLVVCLLSAYKDQLEPALTNIKKLADDIQRSKKTVIDNGNPQISKGRKHLEEEYLQIEDELVTMFDVVESIKKKFNYQNVEDPSLVIRKDDKRIQELCDSLGKMKKEFETRERPTLEIEKPDTLAKELSQKGSSSSRKKSPRKSPKFVTSLSMKQNSGSPESMSNMKKGKKSSSPDALSKFSLALDEDSREGSREGSMDDIDWEFDELTDFPTE